jgi:hypothetical protein
VITLPIVRARVTFWGGCPTGRAYSAMSGERCEFMLSAGRQFGAAATVGLYAGPTRSTRRLIGMRASRRPAAVLRLRRARSATDRDLLEAGVTIATPLAPLT